MPVLMMTAWARAFQQCVAHAQRVPMYACVYACLYGEQVTDNSELGKLFTTIEKLETDLKVGRLTSGPKPPPPPELPKGARAPKASHAAAPEQQHPHSSPRHLLSTKHPGTATLQIKPVNGLPRSETAQNPLPEHTHASQNHSRSQPQQIRGTEQMEAHLGFLSRFDAVHADSHGGRLPPCNGTVTVDM